MINAEQFMLDVKIQINKFIQEINDNDVSSMLQSVQQGKMIRCKLIFLIVESQAVSDSKNKDIYFEACKLGAIVEFIHLASILHDDVLDEAQTRRGKPSINFKHGTKQAIMLGDILYSFAFSKLAFMDNRISQSLSKAVATLSMGELMDVNMSQSFSSDYDKYLDMVYKKTASLIESCCFCAGILSGKDADKLGEYGKNLGIAFQLIDDILDITSDSATLGKPSYSDFAEGKVSVPYILLYNRIANPHDLEKLHKKKLNEQEKLWVQTSMREFDVLDDSINIAKSFSNLAMSSLDDLNDDDKTNQELIKLASNLIKREF